MPGWDAHETGLALVPSFVAALICPMTRLTAVLAKWRTSLLIE
jgi:hypothetical protein